jgi:hypothetical protein
MFLRGANDRPRRILSLIIFHCRTLADFNSWNNPSLATISGRDFISTSQHMIRRCFTPVRVGLGEHDGCVGVAWREHQSVLLQLYVAAEIRTHDGH